MGFRIQLRRDTAAKWITNNSILADGEIGYETDTTYAKIGDGNTHWVDLTYWNAGQSGSDLTVKKMGTTILFPTKTLDFSNEFSLEPNGLNSVFVDYTGSTVNIFDSFGNGATGATGMYLKGSKISSVDKYTTITPITIPYFYTDVSIVAGLLTAVINSKGPDGLALDGIGWNYNLNISGNNLIITHNSGLLPIGLATHATNGSNIFIKSPVGISSTQFSLASSTDHNQFTIYGINSINTGASLNSTVKIIWTFGSSI
jgi:hyaluronoglucosaminidase